MSLTDAEFAALPLRRNVGCVLIGPPQEGRATVFAGQRVDNPEDAWQMPQGGIDAGESAAEAALRELEEETGAPARLVEPVGESAGWLDYELPRELVPRLWGGRFRGQTQKWFAYRFLGRDADIRLDAHHREFRAWAWMPPEELLERIVPFKRTVYERVFAEFAPLLRG